MLSWSLLAGATSNFALTHSNVAKLFDAAVKDVRPRMQATVNFMKGWIALFGIIGDMMGYEPTRFVPTTHIMMHTLGAMTDVAGHKDFPAMADKCFAAYMSLGGRCVPAPSNCDGVCTSEAKLSRCCVIQHHHV